jgi:hypothetical protein
MTAKPKRANQHEGAKGHRVNATTRPTEKRRLDSLHPHPRQAKLFDDLAVQEFLALVEDIRENGMRSPPEILPDGTIVTGHQRVRAAKELGWDEIDVVVRYDLADDDGAAESLLISDNLNRRQLSPLGQARCISALAEIEESRRDRYAVGSRPILARDRVGERLRMSGRNVDRYLAVLEAPQSVQRAFDCGFLPLVLAARVAHLRANVQRRVAESIAQLLELRDAGNGADLRKRIRDLVQSAVEDARPHKEMPLPSPVAALFELKRSLDAGIAEVDTSIMEIVADLRGPLDDAECSSPLIALAAYRRQVVPDLCQRIERLGELLAEIKSRLGTESPPDADGRGAP